MFERRAVAFLDILGFKNLIREAENIRPDRLVSLKTVIESHVRFDNANLDQNVPIEMHLKYLFISDSIILSAPLKQGNYDGLDAIVVKSIQIAQKVLELGHLIRGGISVGPVWHEETNIFGSGYIDAFLTEQNAVYPRISLSKDAATIWASATRAVPTLCLAEGSNQTVDILHTEYYRTRNAGIAYEDYIEPLRVFIQNNLQELPLGSESRSKWEWMAGFYNQALVRHGLGNKRFDQLPMPTYCCP